MMYVRRLKERQNVIKMFRDGRRNGWAGGRMGLGMGGGMGLRVGFININDMYNNDVGQGVVYAYEAYEAK